MGAHVVPPYRPRFDPYRPLFPVPRDVDAQTWVAAVAEIMADCPPPLGLYDGPAIVDYRPEPVWMGAY